MSLANLPRRLTHLAIAALLSAATAVLLSPGPATAEPSAAGPQQAAGWLARQLVDGDHLETEFNGTKYADYGVTADAVLAFAAAGVADTAASNTTDYLAANVTAYAGDGATASYAGPLAKLALVADVRGLNARTFGGVDLLARLASQLQPSGRYSDTSEFGDYSTTFSQSLAIIALKRIDQVPASALSYLAAQQCADGGFPIVLEQTPCVSDADATAISTQALLAAGADATKGVQWLVSHQAADGSFAASPPADSANTNTTGLASVTLRAGGQQAAADKANGFIATAQQGCGTTAPGAIALTPTQFDAAGAPRATAQAILGLVGVPLVSLSRDGADAAIPTPACEPTPTTPPTTTEPPVSKPAPPATTVTSRTLANTGSPVTLLVTTATALVVGGTVLVAASRITARR